MTTPAALPPQALPSPPGPTRAGAARWIAQLGRDPLSAFTGLADAYGDVSAIQLSGRGFVAVRGAEGAHRVLLAGQDNYVKGKTFELVRPALGMGLVTSEAEQWKTSRQLVQPLFAKRHLGVYAEHMSAAAAAALRHWDAEWADGQRILLDEEILRIGLDTVGRALISGDISEDMTTFGTAMGGALDELGHVLNNPLTLVMARMLRRDIQRTAGLVSPRRWKRYTGFTSIIAELTAAMVDRRYRDGHGDRDDLLRLLMESEDEETGQRLDRHQVIDELRTFVGAGHETTAHGLSWMLRLLAEHPDARRRAEEELDAVLGGEAPTDQTAERLPYFTACFQEAMRLYPPAWVIPRTAKHDDVIAGYHIPRGTEVYVSVWATHRDGAVYPDPLRFDPERWLGDAPKQRPRFSYLPFGGGRRMCVGQGFAMLNARILGAMVMQRYRFEVVDRAPVKLHPSITLRAAEGLPMTAHRR